MATVALVDEVLERIGLLRGALNKDAIIRQGELGSTLSFAPLSEELDHLGDFLSSISKEVLVRTPDQLLRRFLNESNGLMERLNRIKQFKPNIPNPESQRRELMDAFTNESGNLIAGFKLLQLESAINALAPGDIASSIEAKLTSELRGFRDLEAELRQYVEDGRRLKEQSEQLIAALQSQAASSAVSRHQKVFRDNASTKRAEAKGWLKATYGVAIATFVLASILSIAGLRPSWLGLDVFDAVQLSLTKLVVVGIGASVAIWCSANYRALRHLAEVSEHRANALATYEVFAASTSDPQERGAILAQSAHAIFGYAPTGYLGKEGAYPDNAPSMIQVIKDASQFANPGKSNP